MKRKKIKASKRSKKKIADMVQLNTQQTRKENENRAIFALNQNGEHKGGLQPAHVNSLQQMVGNRAFQRKVNEIQKSADHLLMRESDEEEKKAGAGSLTEQAALNAEEEGMMEVTPWKPQDRQDLDMDRY